MYRIFCTGVLLLIAFNDYAWNALGHQLIAQIAYDNLTPDAKQMCDKYNHAMDLLSPSPNFVVASTWLDRIRKNDIHSFDSLH